MSFLSDRFPSLRRAVPLLLVVAVLLVYQKLVAPHVPHDHTVELRFEPSPQPITRVEAIWTNPELDPDEVAAGATFQFAPGSAPGQVQSHVRVPDGDFLLDLRVERGAHSSTLKRRVSLTSEHITISVPRPADDAPSTN